MTKPEEDDRGRLLQRITISAKGLLIRAALIGLFFLIVHALGFKEHTTFLTGTPADANTSLNQTILFGVVYLVAYFGLVISAPILVLAAGIFSLLDALFAKSVKPPEATST